MAYADRSTPPPVCEFFDIDFGHAQLVSLGNGGRLFLCSDCSDGDVMRLDLMFGGGKWEQRSPLQAVFASRMLRESTAAHSSDEMAAFFDFYGAWTETGASMTHSFVTLYSLGKHFGKTAARFKEMVSEPLFGESDLRTVADINKRNFIVASAKTDFMAHRAIMQSLFGSCHPAGMIPSVADYDNVSSADLCDFYSRYFVPANMSVYLSGNITPQAVETVSALFGGDWAAGAGAPYERAERVAASAACKETFVDLPEATQTSMRFGLFIPGRQHPDYQPLRMLVTILGGYFGSRLMQNIREEKGYTYGISASMLFYPDTAIMLVSAEVANGCYRQVREEVVKEMERLREAPVDEMEMRNVRHYMMGELMRSFEGAFYVADSKMFLDASHLTTDFYRQCVEALQTVTPADIMRVARLYLDPAQLRMAVVGKL